MPGRNKREEKVALIIDKTRRSVAIIDVFSISVMVSCQWCVKTAVNNCGIRTEKLGILLKCSGELILAPEWYPGKGMEADFLLYSRRFEKKRMLSSLKTIAKISP